MLGAILWRTAALAALWWILTGGDPAAAGWGAAAVVLGVVVSLRLAGPARRMRLAGLWRFVPYFVWHSVRGSFDVAYRALHPALPIDPAIVSLPLRLPPKGPGRVFLTVAVNLMPGTLTAELVDDRIQVHVLTLQENTVEQLRRLESLVGGLFGYRLANEVAAPGDQRA